MARPLFQLGSRLEACAQMIKPCYRMADIGTDHAFLPIWLIKTGKVKLAIASDICSGPLLSAQKNAQKYMVEDQLEVRLSDGLAALQVHEAQEIVIAGMGGMLILRIIEDAPWLKNMDTHLVLQPMSKPERLREGIYAQGFQIFQEKVVLDGGRIYSVMSVKYVGQNNLLSGMGKYMGNIQPGEDGAALYAERICKRLEKNRAGLLAMGADESAGELLKTMREISKTY